MTGNKNNAFLNDAKAAIEEFERLVDVDPGSSVYISSTEAIDTSCGEIGYVMTVKSSCGEEETVTIQDGQAVVQFDD